MRTILFSLASVFTVFLFCGCLSAPCKKENIILASFNIRCPVDKSPNTWAERKERCRAVIKQNKLDIFGVQEAFRHQLDDLIRETDYAFIGGGRDDFKNKGEFTAIIYNKKRFEVIKSGTFGLSEKPDLPGYRSWKSAYPRIATWGLFLDRTNSKKFVYYNTHLDNVSSLARINGVKLLVSHAEKNAANLPLLITGDFNATPESEVYRTATSLLNDSRVISYTPHRGPQNTFTDYGRSNSGHPIDFIFVSGEVKIFSHKTDDTLINGQYPSDHYPVVVELCID